MMAFKTSVLFLPFLRERLRTHKVFTKDQRFNFITVSSPYNHMFWMCIRIASNHPRFPPFLLYIRWKSGVTFLCPRFPPFLLYIRWKSGVTFLWRCFRDNIFFWEAFKVAFLKENF